MTHLTQTKPHSGNDPNVGDTKRAQRKFEAIFLPQQGICRNSRRVSTYIIRRDDLEAAWESQQDLLRNGTTS